ncbi:hypothetical protein [Anaeromyxobacter diazotrophicus]|nr:hypothetical protein [Anaeromyxobacter diazotrophicus]
MAPLLLALQILLATSGQPGGAEHLLAGAQAFREGRYEAALVEFRVAQRLGAKEAAGYAAASLVKLGRAEEAVEVFAAADAAGDDAVLGYYRAIACHDARLYLCADRLLGEVGERAGPRIAEQARRTRAALAAELAREPARASIDWYLGRCAERRADRRPALAGAYCDEAVGLATRRGDRYHLAEAAAERAALTSPPPSGAR